MYGESNNKAYGIPQNYWIIDLIVAHTIDLLATMNVKSCFILGDCIGSEIASTIHRPYS